MTNRTWLRSASLGILALALLGAACGGDDDSGGDAAPSETTVDETTVEETTTTAAGPPSAEESEAQINEATATFFDLLGSGDFEDAADIIENGADYVDEMAHCASLVSGASIEMKTVEIDGDTATTTYDILLNGEVALAGSGGSAVFVDGTWLVAENTFLSLYDAAKDSCDGPPPADNG